MLHHVILAGCIYTAYLRLTHCSCKVYIYKAHLVLHCFCRVYLHRLPYTSLFLQGPSTLRTLHYIVLEGSIYTAYLTLHCSCRVYNLHCLPGGKMHGGSGRFRPEMQKRALENLHRLQWKSLFKVADLVSGVWKVAPDKKKKSCCLPFTTLFLQGVYLQVLITCILHYIVLEGCMTVSTLLTLHYIVLAGCIYTFCQWPPHSPHHLCLRSQVLFRKYNIQNEHFISTLNTFLYLPFTVDWF